MREIVEGSSFAKNFTFIKYLLNSYVQIIEKDITYFRNGKKIYHRNYDSAIYHTIVIPEEGEEEIGSSSYVCPSCGAISTVAELDSNGCLYCASKFLASDLYCKDLE